MMKALDATTKAVAALTEGRVIEKKNYAGIDLVKLISAILVVWLHATETTNPVAVGIQYTFTRFCVPFFFICSGFFFQSGLSKAADQRLYFLKYEKRLVMLFLFWGIVVSAPIVITDYIRSNPGARPIQLILLVFRRMIVIGSGAYWYLVALIISIGFLYLCFRKNWNRICAGGIAIGLILQIGYTSFQGIISSIPLWSGINKLVYFVFSWDLNFFMQGIPFCGIGWLISKHSLSVKKSDALMWTVIFTFLRVVEFLIPRISGSLFWQENSFSIAFIPQAVMIFFLACNCSGIPRYAKSMRQLSTFIYLTHWIILYNIMNPIMLYGLGINVYDPLMIPAKVLITLAACVGLNWVLKKMNDKYILFLIGG